MTQPSVHAIIPAAGAGRRLARAEAPPKQYRTLLGRPMLQWAVERACAHPAIRAATVALAPGDTDFLKLDFNVDCPVDWAAGGASRAHSVLNAVRHVRQVTGADWVLVHDAARPCLDPDSLARLLDEGLSHEHGALLAVPVADTIKRSAGDPARAIETVDRDGLWSAQTPQLFPTNALAEALERQLESGAAPTDEAGAMEAIGWEPRLVAGSPANLKVTWPADIALAEAVLRDARWAS